MTALDALAAAYGIEAEFRDARGDIKRATDATKRALLAALGISTTDEASAQRRLDDDERARWSRPLPPVIVGRDEIAFDAILPVLATAVALTVTFENGEARRMQVTLRDDAADERRAIDGQTFARRRVSIEDAFPVGYHRLTLESPAAEAALIVAPSRCWLPPDLARGARTWGIALQLYLLRSAHNWGIGDFGDLERLVTLLADRGADVIGLNPLHGLFVDEPENASPYSPASRLLLNVLNIDANAVPGFASCATVQARIAEPQFQARLAAAREAAWVDYTQVVDLKLPVLRALFAEWARDDAAFAAFVREGGETLQRSCLFQALHQVFLERDAVRDWREWPAQAHDPSSPWIAEFAREHRDDVDFFLWLQWIADTQLARAAQAAAPMRIGLFRDLAVGADPGGAETWTNQHVIAGEATVGAPPDIHNPRGQDWGLPPFHPHRLREEGYRSFIELVRANMRHAGAIRIDHAMALQHLYWIPRGAAPPDGAYVSYPLDDLVAILALESHRNQCLVIGEDLGTVPEGFRERMAAAGILSYRVLFFETDPRTGAFLEPEQYPELALAVLGSHDLPTLRAWWEAYDIDLKAKLGLYPSPEHERELREQRTRERDALCDAIRDQGLLTSKGAMTEETLFRAAHAYLGRTKALLAMAQLDDLSFEVEPVNVPATQDEHANWRRRLSVPLEALADDSHLSAVVQIFEAEGRTRRARAPQV